MHIYGFNYFSSHTKRTLFVTVQYNTAVDRNYTSFISNESVIKCFDEAGKDFMPLKTTDMDFAFELLTVVAAREHEMVTHARKAEAG